MSQLVQFRQRITAVETIQKITHAMRLIAMSGHARLKQRESFLKAYAREIAQLTALVKSSSAQNDMSQNNQYKQLVIIVTSQKGLCGNFNTTLLKTVAHSFPDLAQYDVITIGKHARTYCNENGIQPLRRYEGLGFSTLSTLSEQLSSYILKHWYEYREITFISNKPVSFFVQRPELTKLSLESDGQAKEGALDTYIWEIDPATVLQQLQTIYLRINVETILYLSLLAEQAARFQSMDGATRNAQTLLETMKRQYNKLRQAKITKELIELSAGAQQFSG